MKQSERRIFLIKSLLQERTEYRDISISSDIEQQKQLLRALMNVRTPQQIGKEFLRIQDEYLKYEIAAKGITDIAELTPVQQGIYLWQGDITTLKCDAVVNAANSGMTGCYIPNHRCIDNAIHTFAGMQLRLICDNLMEQQGYPEPAGGAKITPAFNLPSRYVLHTVGPVISGKVKKHERELLASCYSSCLELAAKNKLESVAFCCISTGEFHFPNELAAEIAVQSVKKFFRLQTGVKKVIFNVFKDLDKKHLQKITWSKLSVYKLHCRNVRLLLSAQAPACRQRLGILTQGSGFKSFLLILRRNMAFVTCTLVAFIRFLRRKSFGAIGAVIFLSTVIWMHRSLFMESFCAWWQIRITLSSQLM